MAAAVEPPLNLGIHEGTMVKRIIDMTPQEREVYYKAVALKAKEHLFAIGQPWVYEKNGQVLAEYADGRTDIGLITKFMFFSFLLTFTRFA